MKRYKLFEANKNLNLFLKFCQNKSLKLHSNNRICKHFYDFLKVNKKHSHKFWL